MPNVFNYRENQPVVWYNRDPAKSNQYCLYCGEFVGAGSSLESDKEHLIGRNFVPSGTLEGSSFNFVFRACTLCNSRKAEVERHISAVTIFNSPARHESPEIEQLAQRKGSRDYHPSGKGLLVKDAHQRIKLESKGGLFNFTAELIGPPQLHRRKVEQLAFNHVQGMFALVTTQNPLLAETTCLLSYTNFKLFASYAVTDWGNPQLVELTRRVNKWRCVANVSAANGFFRVLLRRHPDHGWFWALEWNKFVRVVGVIAHPNEDPVLLSGLPPLQWKQLSSDGLRLHWETPINQADDRLFDAIVGDQD